MKLSTSVKTALAIAGALVAWFAISTLFRAAPDAEAEATAEPLFTVVAATVAPQQWRDTVVIRGRTAAERKVVVRAETAGVVVETPVDQGTPVKAGDTLCRLDIEARQAALAEARAALAKARLDHDAATKLAAEGFRSETAVAAAKASLDLARASVEQAEVRLRQTRLTAPFDGVFDIRTVEKGDFLAVGDPCGTVIQTSPFLITGAVSEREVANIKVGDRGVARIAGGAEVEGTVRFIAAAADPATRTFTVELLVPNEDGALRDGVTADFTVFAGERMAHLIPTSALALDAEGRLGVRLVDETNHVRRVDVRPIGEDPAGVWVAGLDGVQRVIVRGQDFVSDGQEVAVAALSGEPS